MLRDQENGGLGLRAGCLENLNRLEKYAGRVVSVTLPKVRSKEAVELFKMVEVAASDTYRVEVVVPIPELFRLFGNEW
jgi:hypothetical protein